MAYVDVVWRVFTKKYTKFRLGLSHRGRSVTPSERSQEARTKDLEASFSPEGAWTAGPEFAKTPDEGLNKIDDFNRIGSNKSLSRSKRVKSFIQKKCKGISNSFGNGEAGETHVAVAPRSKSTSRANSDVSTTSWYVANDYHSDEEVLNHVTVVKVGVDVRETQNVSSVAVCDEPQVVNVVEDSVQTTDNVDSRNEGGTDHHDSEEIKGEESLQDSDNETFILAQDCPDEEEISKLDKGCSEETLVDEKPQLEEVESLTPLVFEAKTEIERLTDKYFGPLYSNYPRTRPVLVRQARDLLVCSYHGNTARFEAEFCQPAAALMQEVIQRSFIEVACGVSPRGWPLSLGVRGVVLHLGELDASLLRSRDCYLCVRVPNHQPPQVALVWSGGSVSPSPPPSALAMMTATEELPELLQHLVVSVERAIERVPLDDLPFPCPQCHECLSDQDSVSHCQCPVVAEKRDSCIQTSPMYELDNSIPHIDSDEEHEDPERRLSTVRTEVILPPRCIAEVSEKLLMSGIYLPGVHDVDGRSVVVYDAAVVRRAALSHTDIARVVLYYSTLPVRPDRTSNGLTLVCVNLQPEGVHLLDKALVFITKTQRVARLLVSNPDQPPGHSTLPLSKTQCHSVKDSSDLLHFLPEDQTPSECGGRTTHDQLEWVEFFKELEPFVSSCQACGRRLVGVMSDVRSAVDGTMSRRQLSSQHRTMSRVLHDNELQRLRRDGQTTLAALEDRAQWLPDSEDVRLGVERAERLFSEVDRAAKRLDELSDKRREKLRELVKMRALEDETSQVLSWLNHKGEDSLKRHAELASTLPAIKQQEQDFEKFYFISMRHLDKGGDLLEEASQVSGQSGSSGLRDLARSLKNHLRGFSDRLEDTRERLEDTSRCFYLLDKAYEWALEAMKYMSRVKPEDAQNPEPSVKQLKQYLMAHPPLGPEHFTEMMGLAKKLNNDKLLEQCKVAQCRCEETIDQIRSILGSEAVATSWTTSTPLPGRRRSLPSPQSNHTPGPSCACWDPPTTSPPLDDIREECFCRPSHQLQRSCTWQYPTESYDDEDKLSSSADNTTEGSETGTKSGEDLEEHVDECGKLVPPIPVNSHLHCDLSLQMDNMQGGTQTLKTKKTMLLIMREMIQTERDYVKSLEYVIENYIPELVREDIPQALRGQRNVIFGNIEKIYEFHSQFFLQELERCEQTPLSIGQSFLRHEKKFYLYALYNKNKPKSDSLMSEYGSSFFKAKQLELGDKMDLASYLLKPVQRMGKYALLLQQLMKASRQDVADLRDAEKMVRFQLRHGNDLLAMDSLRDCDVNVKEQGRLLRQNEFLVWQGGKGKKCLRQVFLFEELILFSKARRFPDRKNLDIYIYKNSIKTSDIGMTARVGESPTKFEIWFRKRKPNDTFTLQSVSEDIKQAWTEELSNLLWKQAVRNREMRLQEMSSMGIGNKPCLDIRPSADQISDRSISIAQLSKTAPRFRNSIAVMPTETVRKRPHSIISVSSSSGASSSSSSEHRLHHSQCSSAESGIVSDWHTSTSVASDSTSPWPEQQ
ncbi:pleckstrin homology domain-containing family G member 4B-like isoform X2 [Macrosteles quadrilineatus]|uniref:pleckstrin homology domain-containing family G member 4B-like isoform X2 n=1 Tax=Macrosteles quadrilineatus TaxID=74068 RepID=UPI0023E28BF1|nr:pleckstrin homology domain-containing family G member 4B-like isoform X2 [Macrosteles quadrilineatus]